MESIGQVNRYTPRLTTDQQRRRVTVPSPFYTINLCNGTTPFCTFLPYRDARGGGEVYEYHSNFYRMLPGMLKVEVTHAFYRPHFAHFNGLSDEEKEFVLGGALLMAPLAQAIDQQLPCDEVLTTWDYEQYQLYMQKVYGRRSGRSFDSPSRGSDGPKGS